MIFDDFRFRETNRQWASVEDFRAVDKHLADLKSLKYVHNFFLETQTQEPGVFLLFGGRQVGKTTALKQMLLQNILDNKFYKPITSRPKARLILSFLKPENLFP